MGTRFRHNVAVPISGFAALVSTSALALQRWWLTPLMLPPLVVLWWGLRSGADAGPDGIRVRALLGSRTVPWAEVAGLRVDGRRVRLLLDGGGELPLPGVEPGEVPKLVAASGGTLTGAEA